ncbi:MAG: hypothetical protein ACK56I_25640, partial [bacterium]
HHRHEGVGPRHLGQSQESCVLHQGASGQADQLPYDEAHVVGTPEIGDVGLHPVANCRTPTADALNLLECP